MIAEIERRANEVLVVLDEELDARVSALRTWETNAGNLCFGSSLGWRDALNAGCMRADCVFPLGQFRQRDLDKLLPYQTDLVVVGIKVCEE